jgi:very-short-patch-repair endonuclease
VARPLNPANLDQAIQLYLSGEPLEKIQTTSGVSPTRLHRERAIRGIPARKVLDLPAQAIVSAYLSGASEFGLAQQYGVSRGPITRILTEAGVERRGMSEAGLVRTAQQTPEQRRAQVVDANRAARMRRIGEIEKYRRALTVEREGRPGSAGEVRLRRMLRERGEDPTVERAVGPYNVDLAVLPVAMEVLGGGFHGVKERHAERTPYILDAGWHLVMVWNYEGRSSLGPGAADYLVAFLEETRRNPPATCQYRVITGQGELLAACGRESDEFPLVPPPRGRLMAGA